MLNQENKPVTLDEIMDKASEQARKTQMEQLQKAGTLGSFATNTAEHIQEEITKNETLQKKLLEKQTELQRRIESVEREAQSNTHPGSKAHIDLARLNKENSQVYNQLSSLNEQLQSQHKFVDGMAKHNADMQQKTGVAPSGGFSQQAQQNKIEKTSEVTPGR